MKTIAVFGLGKVGSTLVVTLATAGHRVVGVDVCAATVEAINSRTFHSSEPGISQRLNALAPEALRATTDAADAVAATEAAFIIVPTPSNCLGGFSLRYVDSACEAIGKALKGLPQHYTISLVSTVMPGSSQHAIIPRLEAASGRKIGQGLGFCYNPAFIALGEVAKGFEEPDYVLIGEADKDSGDIVQEILRPMIKTDASFERMNPIEAEISKIASNTHETMRVSFANMLLSICSEIPGSNVDHITTALSHRMGKRFFKGATPYGGPCWPRDNVALSAFMNALGVPCNMPREVDIFNREHARYILLKLLQWSSAGMRIGIMGLSYKPGTAFLEASFGCDLCTWLSGEGRPVTVWDPLAMSEARSLFGESVGYASSAEELMRSVDLVVVAIPLPELPDMDWSQTGDALVVDCWRCLPPAATAQIKKYRQLGIGEDADVKQWIKDTLGGRLELLTN